LTDVIILLNFVSIKKYLKYL